MPREPVLVHQVPGRLRLRVAGFRDTPRPAPATAGGAPRGWPALAADGVVKRLEASPERGLRRAEAERRLARAGRNVLPRQERPSPLALVARQFKGLPTLLLAGSSIVSATTGGVADAVATLAVVALNGVLGFVTEGQAERIIHALVDTSTHRARAIRDGEETRLPAGE